MNQGIKLLMLRMDSHPIEFEIEFGDVGGGKSPRQERWRWAVRLLVEADPPVGLLLPKEVQLLRKKYWSIQETAFSKRVMSCLLAGSDSSL